MVDDLAKLPGDDDLEPKRRGLRRLRKAERAFLKQQQQLQQQEQGSSAAAGGGRKKSTAAASAAAGASTVGEAGLPQSTDARGKGRQWERRCWRSNGVDNLTLVVLAAGTIAATTVTAGAKGPMTGDSTTLRFETVLERLAADAAKAQQATAEEGNAAEAKPPAKRGESGGGGSGGGGNKGGKGGKKGGKGAGKGKEASAAGGATAEGEEESDEVAAARKQKEDREADVKAWAEGLCRALEGETFVTTAHRAAVAARDTIVLGLAERTMVGSIGLAVVPAGLGHPFRLSGFSAGGLQITSR